MKTDSFRYRQKKREERQTHSDTDRGGAKIDRLFLVKTEEERVKTDSFNYCTSKGGEKKDSLIQFRREERQIHSGTDRGGDEIDRFIPIKADEEIRKTDSFGTDRGEEKPSGHILLQTEEEKAAGFIQILEQILERGGER